MRLVKGQTKGDNKRLNVLELYAIYKLLEETTQELEILIADSDDYEVRADLVADQTIVSELEQAGFKSKIKYAVADELSTLLGNLASKSIDFARSPREVIDNNLDEIEIACNRLRKVEKLESS